MLCATSFFALFPLRVARSEGPRWSHPWPGPNDLRLWKFETIESMTWLPTPCSANLESEPAPWIALSVTCRTETGMVRYGTVHRTIKCDSSTGMAAPLGTGQNDKTSPVRPNRHRLAAYDVFDSAVQAHWVLLLQSCVWID